MFMTLVVNNIDCNKVLKLMVLQIVLWCRIFTQLTFSKKIFSDLPNFVPKMINRRVDCQPLLHLVVKFGL